LIVKFLDSNLTEKIWNCLTDLYEIFITCDYVSYRDNK
jgi:hypothetical protein